MPKALKAGIAALVVVVLSWWIVATVRNRRPYQVDDQALSGWTLVAGAPGDLALVGMKPPPNLSSGLYEQLTQRVQQPLAAPPAPMMPLVLREEYSEGLQGVFSLDDILDVARSVGVDGARFEPLCLAHRRDAGKGAVRDVYFVVFDSPLFREFRQQLTPLFPEHAGNGTYDPGALRPILSIASTDRQAGRWWPIPFEEGDCQTSLNVN
jgi:hypothetical protein